MRKALCKTLIDIAKKDKRLLFLTADLGFMVLEEFEQAYPKSFFNVGVAEANMVGLATGLASSGYIPFIYSIATFSSMRAYEQIRNGPIIHNLPVRVVGVGGGFEYGHAGFTHHALEDFGLTRIQPGLTVIAPADYRQAETAILNTYDLPGPIYYRISKSGDYIVPGLEGRFKLGRLETVREGKDVLILSIGSITKESVEAAKKLSSNGIEATIAVVSSLRPVLLENFVSLLSRFQLAVTVEEHYIDCGLGSLVAEVVAERMSSCRLVRCGVKRASNGISGSEAYLRKVHGLSSEGILNTVLLALGELNND